VCALITVEKNLWRALVMNAQTGMAGVAGEAFGVFVARPRGMQEGAALGHSWRRLPRFMALTRNRSALAVAELSAGGSAGCSGHAPSQEVGSAGATERADPE
jgi:hypothetical protein